MAATVARKPRKASARLGAELQSRNANSSHRARTGAFQVAGLDVAPHSSSSRCVMPRLIATRLVPTPVVRKTRVRTAAASRSAGRHPQQSERPARPASLQHGPVSRRPKTRGEAGRRFHPPENAFTYVRNPSLRDLLAPPVASTTAAPATDRASTAGSASCMVEQRRRAPMWLHRQRSVARRPSLGSVRKPGRHLDRRDRRSRARSRRRVDQPRRCRGRSREQPKFSATGRLASAGRLARGVLASRCEQAHPGKRAALEVEQIAPVGEPELC